MKPWTCFKCGCDYSWFQPETVNGSDYCATCADVSYEEENKPTTDIPIWAWMILVFFVGILCGRQI